MIVKIIIISSIITFLNSNCDIGCLSCTS